VSRCAPRRVDHARRAGSAEHAPREIGPCSHAHDGDDEPQVVAEARDRRASDGPRVEGGRRQRRRAREAEVCVARPASQEADRPLEADVLHHRIAVVALGCGLGLERGSGPGRRLGGGHGHVLRLGHGRGLRLLRLAALRVCAVRHEQGEGEERWCERTREARARHTRAERTACAGRFFLGKRPTLGAGRDAAGPPVRALHAALRQGGSRLCRITRGASCSVAADRPRKDDALCGTAIGGCAAVCSEHDVPFGQSFTRSMITALHGASAAILPRLEPSLPGVDPRAVGLAPSRMPLRVPTPRPRNASDARGSRTLATDRRVRVLDSGRSLMASSERGASRVPCERVGSCDVESCIRALHDGILWIRAQLPCMARRSGARRAGAQPSA
jgi:hypothetical protein